MKPNNPETVTRRDVLRTVGIGCVSLAAGTPAAQAWAPLSRASSPKTPRNLLVITTHDSGRHFGCYGHPTVRTPAIDALAKDGCRFTQFFAVNPICSPSRASLFTGLYPQTHGVTTIVSRKKGITMRDPGLHLAGILGRAGFRTGLFGHQHEVAAVETLGFERRPEPGPRPPADQVAAEVADYLGQTKDRFFLEVNLNETHTPYHFGGAEPDTEKGVGLPPYVLDNSAARDWMAAYQGAARAADRAVGRILEALEASGHAGDTLVVFTSDHGIELPRAKWFLYDPGLAVPLLLRWPNGGIRPGSRCDLLSSNVDFVPTVLELFGLEALAHLQGMSFAPAVLGKPMPRERGEVFGFQTGFQMRCVRTPRYKLIRNFELHPPCTQPADVSKPRQDTPVSPLVELYDLESDPREFHNLADDPGTAPVRKQLNARLRQWMVELEDPILQTPEGDSAFHAAAVAGLMADA